MMHGRGGAYSSGAKGRYDAATLSQRHRCGAGCGRRRAMSRSWSTASVRAAIRGAFPRFSYEDRPAEVDEVTVRPLDAYGALAYLRTRPDVVADRIGLQGWSNGGSAALATMAADAPGIPEHRRRRASAPRWCSIPPAA